MNSGTVTWCHPTAIHATFVDTACRRTFELYSVHWAAHSTLKL